MLPFGGGGFNRFAHSAGPGIVEQKGKFRSLTAHAAHPDSSADKILFLSRAFSACSSSHIAMMSISAWLSLDVLMCRSMYGLYVLCMYVFLPAYTPLTSCLLSFMMFAIAMVDAGLAGFEDHFLLHHPFTSWLLSFILFIVAIVGASPAGFEDDPFMHSPFTSCLSSFMLFAVAIVGAGLASFEDYPLLHSPFRFMFVVIHFVCCCHSGCRPSGL